MDFIGSDIHSLIASFISRVPAQHPSAHLPHNVCNKGSTGLSYDYLDELNDGHLGVIALSGNRSQHTRVSTFLLGVTVSGRLEKSVN